MNRWTGHRADQVVGPDGTHPTVDQATGAYVTIPYNTAGMTAMTARADQLGLPYHVNGSMLFLGDREVLAVLGAPG